MSLKKFIEKYRKGHKPKEKVISAINNEGRVIFTDGTTGGTLSPWNLKPGDRVLTWYGFILRFKWEDAKVHMPTVSILPMLIVIAGETTMSHDERIFYLINGNTLQKQAGPVGFNIIDDGKYCPVIEGEYYDDPDLYEYYYEGNGLKIPAPSSGISAKQINGAEARVILSNSIEDEIFLNYTKTVSWGGPIPPAYNYSYDYLQHENSLVSTPFRITGKPFMARYANNEVISMHHKWGQTNNGVLVLDAWTSKLWGDTMPIVDKIYKKNFQGERTYVEVNNENGDSALIGTVQHYRNKDLMQKLLRGKEFHLDDPYDPDGYDFAEPVVIEDYDMSNLAFSAQSDSLHRCSDPANTQCYMWDSNIVSGRTYDEDDFIDLTGFQTIADDIKLPYTVDEDGKLTYVRIQKDTHFTQSNVGIYCRDTLIEESGWENTIRLYDDNESGVRGDLLLIRKRSYKILHAHHDENFNLVFFRKTVYKSHSDPEMLPYSCNRIYGTHVYYCKLKKTKIESETTYHIYCNGQIINLDYKCENEEYQLSAYNATYDFSAIPVVWFHLHTWLDLDNGENITRIFTTAGDKQLIVGFDVFPMSFTHTLKTKDTAGGYKDLIVEYDQSSFPPYSDLQNLSDRKWLLFDKSGANEELGPLPDYERINAMCLIERS